MRNMVYDKDKKQVDINASINKTKNGIEENKKKLEKEIKSYDKKIKGYNKQIINNEKAIESIGYEAVNEEEEIEEQEDLEENQAGNIEIEDLYEEENKIRNVKKEEKQVVKAEKKPKWFQFIKRFKNWRANRKMASKKKEEKKINIQPKDIKKEEPKENGAKSDFTQSLKYQVVRDIAQQMQKEKLEEIKSKDEEDTER